MRVARDGVGASALRAREIADHRRDASSTTARRARLRHGRRLRGCLRAARARAASSYETIASSYAPRANRSLPFSLSAATRAAISIDFRRGRPTARARSRTVRVGRLLDFDFDLRDPALRLGVLDDLLDHPADRRAGATREEPTSTARKKKKKKEEETPSRTSMATSPRRAREFFPRVSFKAPGPGGAERELRRHPRPRWPVVSSGLDHSAQLEVPQRHRRGVLLVRLERASATPQQRFEVLGVARAMREQSRATRLDHRRSAR